MLPNDRVRHARLGALLSSLRAAERLVGLGRAVRPLALAPRSVLVVVLTALAFVDVVVLVLGIALVDAILDG